ncbi:MAG: hypothetical protein K2P04_10270 [Oscillospiraceae bacterium]|nr:hypothetical protein [Oscillospiraceae bacterium]
MIQAILLAAASGGNRKTWQIILPAFQFGKIISEYRFGNNTFDSSHFARRRKQRQPQNMADNPSALSVRKDYFRI